MAYISRSKEVVGNEYVSSNCEAGLGDGVEDRGIKAKDGLRSAAMLPVKSARLRDAAYPLRLRIMREAVMLTTASAKLDSCMLTWIKYYYGVLTI